MNVVRLPTASRVFYDARRSDGLLRQGGSANPGMHGERKSSTDDADAQFARLVLPYLDDAYSLARWLTGNGTDAEDVVQDACLRAFRAIGGFAGGSARAWLLTIVRHCAYAWLRKNRPSAVVAVEDLEAVERAEARPDPGGDTPETALIAKADAARLRAAISQLPEPFREAVVLRDIHGLDYREIAEVTGMPMGTVMSRLARARRRLIAALGRSER
jgi:RNA polymerase sigma-70 factor (ECF subfamily)